MTDNKNKVMLYINKAVKDHNTSNIVKGSFKDNKFYIKRFIIFIMNSIQNSSIKCSKFRSDMIDNISNDILIDSNSDNYIITELDKIIRESVKDQCSDSQFLEKVKDIYNIDKSITDIRERIVTQLTDSINQNKLYKQKIDDIKKDIEKKVIDGEIKESNMNGSIKSHTDYIDKTHKHTLLNIISQKLGEYAIINNCEKYAKNNVLDIEAIYEDAREIYTLFEVLNSFNMYRKPIISLIHSK